VRNNGDFQMRNGSAFLLGSLAATLFAASTNVARAQDEIPLEFGTYAQQKDWCKMNRADQNGPDFKQKRAYINLSATEMNWESTVGRITNVSVERNRINLGVELTADAATESRNLQLIRKNRKLFVLTGINFFHCKEFQPNPRLGR
jgi:hypothetical protein